MKWPEWLMLIRHDVSAYNVLKEQKNGDPLYRKFLKEWEKDFKSKKTRKLASKVKERFALGKSDASTPLRDPSGGRARQTGLYLAENHEPPDVIFVSPYERTRETLKHLARGWPVLNGIVTYEEERIREQEHELALLYNDWRVFQTFHPKQKHLRDLLGPYWYKYPQGENVPDVRDRARSWFTTLTRDFAGKKVLAITHHLTILSVQANLERWGESEFLSADAKDKPINCGVTKYVGHPEKGKEGRLVLESYNQKYYND